MAQPPLSRAIAGLESRLGVRLLERSSRGVAPTPAGVVLLDEARRVVDGATAAWHRTVRAGAPTPELVVAVKPCGDGGLPAGILRRYRTDGGWPEPRVAVGGWGEQAAMPRDGRADVALLRTPGDERGLDTEPPLAEPRVAALPAGHPPAGRKRLRRRELDGEFVPHWPATGGELAAYRAAVDRHPDVVAPPGPAVEDFAQLLHTVALGQGIAFVPASASQVSHPGVVFVPVSDLSPSHVVAAWSESSRSTAVAAFVRVAAPERPEHLLRLA